MIRLKSILTEINMAGLVPYATAFTWRKLGNNEFYDTKVAAAGTVINMVMTSDDPESRDWTFSFFLPNKTDDQRWTTNASTASAPEGLSYLRVMLTCAYGVRDFADTYNADRIDISGADSGFGKSAQKTRIYHDLLLANKSMFADFKIQKSFTGHLFLIRIRKTDATGMEDNV